LNEDEPNSRESNSVPTSSSLVSSYDAEVVESESRKSKQIVKDIEEFAEVAEDKEPSPVTPMKKEEFKGHQDNTD